MTKKTISLSLFLLIGISSAFAQKIKKDTVKEEPTIQQGEIDGQVVEWLITDDGDTVILADFSEVSITSNQYATRKEQYHHYRVKRRALKVHKYAVEAIKIFKEVQETTTDMKKRKRKKHIKRLQKDLKKSFDAPLRKLSRYEGFVLMCMIERELDMPLYKLVKGLKGWWSAKYWSNLALIYGYNIKDGYDAEKDPILERILNDLKVD